MQKPCLIIVGAGTLQVPAINEAKNLDLLVAAIDGNPNALGMSLADYPICVSTKDTQGILKALDELKDQVHFKGVMTAGTDASLTVAQIANHLGLEGLSESDALNCTNKWLMRNALKEKGVPMPEFYLASSPQEAAQAFLKLNKPKAVIKPIDSMGARGVKQVFSEKEAFEAFNDSSVFSSTKEVLIEELLEGPELSIDALVFNDRFYECGVADRLINQSPYFIESGHNLPSEMDEASIKSALDMMHQASKALGITWGATKGDVRMTPDGPRIVEIAARLSGGFMSGFTFPYATGVNLTKAAVMLAVGLTPPDEMLIPTRHEVSIERGILYPRKGTFKAVHHVKEALKIPYIKDIYITKPALSPLGDTTSNLDKIGHILAQAPTLELAQDAVNKALSCLKIDIE